MRWQYIAREVTQESRRRVWFTKLSLTPLIVQQHSPILYKITLTFSPDLPASHPPPYFDPFGTMSDELLELLYFIASSQKEDAEKIDLKKDALQASRMKDGTSEAPPMSILPVAQYDDFDLYGGFQVFRVYM